MDAWITGAIALVVGLGTGAGANALTRILIRHRCEQPFRVWYINCPLSPLMWALGAGGLLCWQGFATGDLLWVLRLSIMLLACACLSATDARIRKVPNSMLLLLLAQTVVFTLLDWQSFHLWERALSVVSAVVVFQIPALFRLQVGWGDVKLAIVIALGFSFLEFLQVLVVMGLGFLIAAVYLTATHKGTLKTPIPMGPFLALGTIFTAICPLL